MGAGPEDLGHVIKAPISQSIVVRAGPGAGKTYLMAQRIAYLLKAGLPVNSEIAAITYTNTGVEELEAELIPRHFPSWPGKLFTGTIHSFLIEHVLGPYGHFLPELPGDFRIAPPDGFAAWFCPPQISKNLPAYKLHLFESVDYGLDGKLLCHQQTGGWRPSVLQMRAFKDAMHGRGYLDLHDVLFFSWRVLRQFPSVLACLTARFASVLVDEFQDTTEIQNAILELLNDAGNTSLFLVGDPDQSIFSFAGAVPSTFARHLASTRFLCPLCGSTEHRIKGNRRSSGRIVKHLNKLSTMPLGQEPLAKWMDYPEPVWLVVGRESTSVSSALPDRAAPVLGHFFGLLDRNHIDPAGNEAFCVLAHQNRTVAELRRTYEHDSVAPARDFDSVKHSNSRLHGILRDLLVAYKHREVGEWASAFEATERAIARLLYRTASARWCDFEDATIGLERADWPIVVWAVMEELSVEGDEDLACFCRRVKGLVDRAVRAAGGKPIRRKLGILDCSRGRTAEVVAACKAVSALAGVTRPGLAGESFRTIHKAKGIQRDAVLVFAIDHDELERWLTKCDLPNDECSRRGYVAMSRARKILCLACPNVPQSSLDDFAESSDLHIVTV